MSMLLDTVSIPGWLKTLTDAVTKVIGPILILVATAGIIYAIVVGVKFVKAEDKNQRDEAKAKLISVIVGIVVTGVLIALFYWLAYAIQNGQIQFDNWYDTGNSTGSSTNGTGSSSSTGFIIGAIKHFIK